MSKKLYPIADSYELLVKAFVCVCGAGARRGGFGEEEHMGPALHVLQGRFRRTGLETVTQDSEMHSS